MKVIQGLNNLHRIPRGTICSIGVFDGIHRGHQSILEKLVKQAKREKENSLVITFHPHPSRLVKPEQSSPLLISLRHRIFLMEKMGIDYCLIIPFNKKFARISPLFFVKNILYKHLGINALYLGRNFRFGYKQKGDINLLREMGKQFAFRLFIVPPVRYGKKIISSSWIREEVGRGNLDLVSHLLGRHYSLYGRVSRGEGRGNSLGFPTANLDVEQEMLPPSGVYLAKAYLESKDYPALLYIGYRPTFFERSSLSVEVYLLNFRGNLYGKYLEVELIKKLRGERKFKKISSLISAMKRDELSARQFFS
ncbi:MAG: bifunctional riboflavin kinase/FAD synthetase [Candidatus Omnitrophica bacterium]|nr:bifunctional riboflavin kinase/FAD synthetase [Candidatus Omnitrophota bacterium]